MVSFFFSFCLASFSSSSDGMLMAPGMCPFSYSAFTRTSTSLKCALFSSISRRFSNVMNLSFRIENTIPRLELVMLPKRICLERGNHRRAVELCDVRRAPRVELMIHDS